MGRKRQTFPRKPGLFWRAILRCLKLSDRVFPWYRWPPPFGIIVLGLRRVTLQRFNLIPVGQAQIIEASLTKKEKAKRRRDGNESRVLYRTDDGKGNDVGYLDAGKLDTLFGRNMASTKVGEREVGRNPDVGLVTKRLLERTGGYKPAGLQFNVVAAAWIQAMVHDWMNHEKEQGYTELKGAGCPLEKFKFHPTAIEKDSGGTKNVRTAWWDASFLYGQNPEQVGRARLGEGGKLKIGRDNRLPVDENGVYLVGDHENSWVGVTLLQELFAKEHNKVCDVIAKAHPDYTDEDLFRKARLVVAAVVAKIHTIDWTVELLKTRTLRTSMRGNWYGLLGKTVKEKLKISTGNEVLSGLVGLKRAQDHGIPFSLTEEFNAVYRLHPLMPDALPISGTSVPLEDLVGLEGQKELDKHDPLDIWASALKYPCGALTLFNYPSAFRKLTPTNVRGLPDGEKIDLPMLELYRDRERGLLKYNDFRRALHMNPMKSFEQLTGKDEQMVAALKEVYTGGIETLDLLVGLLAEKKIRGFAISETSFHIFILMASRRLEADRFFTQDFNAKVYTKEGFEWVQKTESLKDVLARHYPKLEIRSKSAFTPWENMPK